MGYTHYWTTKSEPLPSDWQKFFEGAIAIIETAKEAGIDLEDNSDKAGWVININGVGANAHEVFVLDSGDELGFNFCKTAEKPYDAVVTAILIHAKTILGDAIEIKSDGNWDEWDSGKVLYETVFDSQPESVLA